MDQFYFCSVFTQMKPGIHFGGITVRVAIYKSNKSLTFKIHLNLFCTPCYGLKHISVITFVFKKNTPNQQQLNKNTKQTTEHPQRKQIKTPMCHPSPPLQAFFSFTSIFRFSQYGFCSLGWRWLLQFCIFVFMQAGKKEKGNAGGMKEMMKTVISERGLAFPNGNSWNILN